MLPARKAVEKRIKRTLSRLSSSIGGVVESEMV